MGATPPPELTVYQVDKDGRKEETDEIYLGKVKKEETDESETMRIRIENARNKSAARLPIIYIDGQDKETVASKESSWIMVKNKEINGEDIDDEFEPVSKDLVRGYKKLAGNIYEEGYVEFEVKAEVPDDAEKGDYNFDYIIEYEYTT